MSIGQLLDRIREHYLHRFSEVIEESRAQDTVISEPALRRADGEYATTPDDPAPTRIDLIICVNGIGTKSINVDTETMVTFEPIEFAWQDGTKISLAPFQWNFCVCMMEHDERFDPQPLYGWFKKGFEEANPEGLFHSCVHYMEIKRTSQSRSAISMDFGSAPVEAFEEFLDSMILSGAQRIEIGQA